MIYVAVCDDDIRYAKSIGQEIIRIILKTGLKGNLSVYASGEKLLDAVRRGQSLDILFLDYEMPGIKGSEVAALLRKRDRTFKLVFLSSYEDKAFILFDYDMSGFVPKKNAAELLEPAINRALKQLLEEREDLEFFTLVHDESGKENIRISVKDIIYFDTAGKTVTMYVNPDMQTYTLGRRAMSSLEEEYGTRNFVRISRATLVNITYVTSYGDNFVRLLGGKTLHMSYRRKSAFENQFLPMLHGR